MKLLLLLLACCPILAAEKLTPETLMNIKRVYDFKFSPDGKQVLLHCSASDMEKNESSSLIYLVDTESREAKKVETTSLKNYGAKYASDPGKIFYMASVNDSMSLYSYELASGRISRIEKDSLPVSNFRVSADGRTIAFASGVKLDKTMKDIYPDLPKANAMAYTDLPVRHWDKFTDENYNHIFILNQATGKTLDIMPGEKHDCPVPPHGGEKDYAISPDGKEIAYVCKKVDDFEASTNTDIYLYDIAAGRTKNITSSNPGYDTEPRYSPDGRYIAYLSMERAGYEADKERLMVYDRQTGSISYLTERLDQPASRHLWAPDNKNIYFVAPNGIGSNHIYRIDRESRAFEKISEGIYDFGLRGMDISPDGRQLVASRENWNDAPELFLIDTKTKDVEQLTFFNKEIDGRIDKCKIINMTISATDGKPLQMWIMLPPDFSLHNNYPLITYCQGGPQQMVSQYFSHGWSMLAFASRGYVVVAPNRRGCPGFGQEWTDAINQDYAGMPLEDIKQATRYMLATGYIDSSRTAAIGASAGGYAVFQLAGTHEGLYKSFVSHCGIFNMESMYGSTEELFFTNWDNGGPYWKNKSYYEKSSPHQFVEKWNTPMLIITGEKDFRVPYAQSLEAFTAAQSLGVKSKLLYFPAENHWVLHPQEQVLWYREVFDFLDGTIKEKPEPKIIRY